MISFSFFEFDEALSGESFNYIALKDDNNVIIFNLNYIDFELRNS